LQQGVTEEIKVRKNLAEEIFIRKSSRDNLKLRGGVNFTKKSIGNLKRFGLDREILI